jgi:hypothetical protein
LKSLKTCHFHYLRKIFWFYADSSNVVLSNDVTSNDISSKTTKMMFRPTTFGLTTFHIMTFLSNDVWFNFVRTLI